MPANQYVSANLTLRRNLNDSTRRHLRSIIESRYHALHLLGNVRETIREFDERHTADQVLQILSTMDDLAYLTTPGAGVV